jgi:hypothetical protein
MVFKCQVIVNDFLSKNYETILIKLLNKIIPKEKVITYKDLVVFGKLRISCFDRRPKFIREINCVISF